MRRPPRRARAAGTPALARVTDPLAPGLVAVVLGALAGALLLVPFVAISYRRRGTITLHRSLLWSAALVYSWAIWAPSRQGLLGLVVPRRLRGLRRAPDADLPGCNDVAASALAIAAVVAALVTARGRGLPGVVTGHRLVDDRDRAEGIR